MRRWRAYKPIEIRIGETTTREKGESEDVRRQERRMKGERWEEG